MATILMTKDTLEFIVKNGPISEEQKLFMENTPAELCQTEKGVKYLRFNEDKNE